MKKAPELFTLLLCDKHLVWEVFNEHCSLIWQKCKSFGMSMMPGCQLRWRICLQFAFLIFWNFEILKILECSWCRGGSWDGGFVYNSKFKNLKMLKNFEKFWKFLKILEILKLFWKFWNVHDAGVWQLRWRICLQFQLTINSSTFPHST